MTLFVADSFTSVTFAGKTFLNSIEYLDEDTNEWTTFVPKIPEENQNITEALYPTSD